METGDVARTWRRTGNLRARMTERDGEAMVPAAVRGALHELDDAALVGLARAGSTDAFNAIVRRHQRAVYQLCYRFLDNHEDASDAAQETYLRAYRGLRHFKGDSAFTTWLYRISVNACLNRISARGPASVPLDVLDVAADQRQDPAHTLLSVERSQRVRAAIARLPPKQRATLILRVYHELSHREIADLVDSSVGAVKANFFHALRNLKRLLGGDAV